MFGLIPAPTASAISSTALAHAIAAPLVILLHSPATAFAITSPKSVICKFRELFLELQSLFESFLGHIVLQV